MRANGSARAHIKNGDLFIKTAPLSAADMFAAEADGLAELKSASAIRVPQVVQTGRGNNVVYLALEWLDMEQADSTVERYFGEQLAELHRTTRDQFGWHRDNTIGLTPQINTRSDDWVQFFREHRLGFQLTLAMQNGFAGDLKDRGERLLKRLHHGRRRTSRRFWRKSSIYLVKDSYLTPVQSAAAWPAGAILSKDFPPRSMSCSKPPGRV